MLGNSEDPVGTQHVPIGMPRSPRDALAGGTLEMPGSQPGMMQSNPRDAFPTEK